MLEPPSAEQPRTEPHRQRGPELEGQPVTSFRLKLVVYFLLLSLLPLAAAFSGFAAVAKRSETRLVDARLQAGLRAALAAYEERLSAADASARALARSPSFQRALAAHDTRALDRAVKSSASIVVAAPRESPSSTFAVLSLQSKIDASSTAIEHRLLLALVALLGLVAVVAYFEGRTIVRTVSELSAAARALARGRLDERVRVRGRDELAVLGRAFNDMASDLEARLEELEAERARLRDAFSLFGEALAATHDPSQLLRVVVETAVEATGAAGGAIVGAGGEVARIGSREPHHELLELPLSAARSSFGTLTLFGDRFGDDERMTAASLAAHAVVALENERLHRIVERQALADPLTGLANRRHAQEV